MKNREEKGVILIVTLWVLATLSLLAMGLMFRVSLELKSTKYTLDRLKMLYLAKAGIMRAIIEIENDSNSYDSLYECGIELEEGESKERIFKDVELDGGTFTVSFYDASGELQYGIIDEESRLNINSLSHSLLKSLLVTIGEIDDKEASDTAYSIIDWIDVDSFKSSPGSAEERYYQGLEFPYNCKNSPLENPEELLLVKGMHPEIYGKIKDFITVYGEGRVNFNTASQETLGVLGIDDDFSEKIISLRSGGDEIEGTEDDHVFKNTGVIISDIEAFTELTLQESVQITNLINKDLLTVKSDYFKIHSIAGTYDKKVIGEITAIAERLASGAARIRYWHED